MTFRLNSCSSESGTRLFSACHVSGFIVVALWNRTGLEFGSARWVVRLCQTSCEAQMKYVVVTPAQQKYVYYLYMCVVSGQKGRQGKQSGRQCLPLPPLLNPLPFHYVTSLRRLAHAYLTAPPRPPKRDDTFWSFITLS